MTLESLVFVSPLFLWDVWSSIPGSQFSINPDSLIMQDDGNLIAFEREVTSNEKRQIFATNSFGKCPTGNIFFSFRLCYALCKKCPYSELFWSAFSRIWTEYGEYYVFLRIQSKCGKMRTRLTPNTDTFYADGVMHVFYK